MNIESFYELYDIGTKYDWYRDNGNIIEEINALFDEYGEDYMRTMGDVIDAMPEEAKVKVFNLIKQVREPLDLGQHGYAKEVYLEALNEDRQGYFEHRKYNRGILDFYEALKAEGYVDFDDGNQEDDYDD